MKLSTNQTFPRPTDTEMQENKKSSLLLNVPLSASSFLKKIYFKIVQTFIIKLLHLHSIIGRGWGINPQLYVGCRDCLFGLELYRFLLLLLVTPDMFISTWYPGEKSHSLFVLFSNHCMNFETKQFHI